MKALVILILLPLRVLSQDLSGIWTGSISTQGSELLYELVISGNNEKTGGYSLTVFTIDGVENIGIKSVILKQKKGSISLEDDELIYDNYTTTPKRVKLYGSLFLNMEDSDMTLTGNFHTRTMDFRASNENTYSGTITLHRLNNSAQTKLISQLDKLNLLNTLAFFQPKKKEKENEPVAKVEKPVAIIPESKPKEPPVAVVPKEEPATIMAMEDEERPKLSAPITNEPKKPAYELAKKDQEAKIPVSITESKPKLPTTSIINTPTDLAKAAAAIDQRRTEIIRSVFFHSDSLVLSLYDNGTVDGDTVSVVMNGKVIIARKSLSESAIRLVVPVPRELGDSILLTMYAENLGAIPPNTGLLFIQDGNDRNEIRFEGDMKKSSAVILRRIH